MASDRIAHNLVRNDERQSEISGRRLVGVLRPSELAGEASDLKPGALSRVENPLIRLGIGLALVAAATVGRLALGIIDPRGAHFVLYLPAILLASLLGGLRVGAVAATASVVLAYVLFVAPKADLAHPSSVAALNMILFAAASAAVVAIGGRVGALIEGLAQSRAALRVRTREYDALFGMMSEGFALCEAIFDDEGRLSDYVVLQMNPALLEMLGVGPEAIGGKFSAVPGDQSAWLGLCNRVLKTGEPQSFEYFNASTGRWHEIHVNRVTATRMAQLFFDITERKAAEEYRTRMFEELNHRVKNNLSVVSAILGMQARDAEPATRDNLMKAVDRVQSIAEVHGSLSRGREAGQVDFAAYLQNLCDRLAESLLADDRIQIVVETAAMDIAAEHAVPLGMVVNELVTNAVKYAYPPPAKGIITVCLKVTEAGPVLAVGDSGCGLPGDIETKTGGLGFSIIHSMVRQVGGTLTIHRRPARNSKYSCPRI